MYRNAQIQGTAGAVTSVTGTAPITSTGGATPAIGLDQTAAFNWSGVHTFSTDWVYSAGAAHTLKIADTVGNASGPTLTIQGAKAGPGNNNGGTIALDAGAPTGVGVGGDINIGTTTNTLNIRIGPASATSPIVITATTITVPSFTGSTWQQKDSQNSFMLKLRQGASPGANTDYLTCATTGDAVQCFKISNLGFVTITDPQAPNGTGTLVTLAQAATSQTKCLVLQGGATPTTIADLLNANISGPTTIVKIDYQGAMSLSPSAVGAIPLLITPPASATVPALKITGGATPGANGDLALLQTSALATAFRVTGAGVISLGSTTYPTTATQGDLLFASAANVIGNLADVAAGSYLRSGGVGANPVYSTMTLPNAATTGDILAATGSNAIGVIAASTAGNVLTANGAGVASTYQALPGASVSVQTFTASGTYTPVAGIKFAVVECVGSGGGGGGAAASPAGASGGAGGGSGAYSRVRLTAAQIGASQTVTVGTAGTAGTTGNNAGGAGGDTSLGTLCVAKGGSGGAGAAANTGGAGAAGGAASGGTGDMKADGNVGGNGSGDGITTVSSQGGFGEPSVFGGGVSGGFRGASAGVADGVAGKAFGAGGGGGTSLGSASTAAGGAGGAGIVIVTEYK